MSRFSGRRLALCTILGALLVLPVACAEKTHPPAAAVAPTAESPTPPEPADRTPREVELSDAKMTFREPTIVLFEVKYRFTKGQPQIDHEYQVEVTFPGTSNSGVKPMIGRQLQKEGVLKDGFELSQPGAKSFEIKVTEAPSPRDRFKKISNLASGQIQ